jgi:peptidoglycan/LPS O-acetylase OafA/YrhL
MAKTDKFLGVELLRFLSGLSVLVWHYQHFFINPIETDFGFKKSLLPFYKMLFPFYEGGDFAVMIFWMISGFIFTAKYSGIIFQNAITLDKFFILRFSRLYPLHFFTLLYVAAAQGIYAMSHRFYGFDYFIYPFNDLKHFVMNLLFIQNWGPNLKYSFNGPAWSVSVEVLIYFLFYLIARRVKLNWSRSLTISLIALIAVFNGCIDPPFAQCILLFFSGGLVFFVQDRWCQSLSRRGQFYAGIVLVSLSLYVFNLPFTLSHILASLAALLGIVLMFNRLSESPILELLGNLTYSSYLIQFPIQITLIIVLDALGVSRHLFYSPAVFVCYILAVLVLARMIYVQVERPLMLFLRSVMPQMALKPLATALKGGQ